MAKTQAERLAVLEERVNESNNKMDKLTSRVSDLTVELQSLVKSLEGVVARMDRVDGSIRASVDSNTQRMDSIEKRIDDVFNDKLFKLSRNKPFLITGAFCFLLFLLIIVPEVVNAVNESERIQLILGLVK